MLKTQCQFFILLCAAVMAACDTQQPAPLETPVPIGSTYALAGDVRDVAGTVDSCINVPDAVLARAKVQLEVLQAVDEDGVQQFRMSITSQALEEGVDCLRAAVQVWAKPQKWEKP